MCSSCHFIKTAKSAVWTMDSSPSRVIKGDIASHLLKPALPGDVQAGEPDSCGQCHSGNMQGIIDTRQNDIKSRIADVEARLAILGGATGLPARDSAYTDLTIVESEGSSGIHNYQYATAILDAIDNFLDRVKQLRLPLVRVTGQ